MDRKSRTRKGMKGEKRESQPFEQFQKRLTCNDTSCYKTQRRKPKEGWKSARYIYGKSETVLVVWYCVSRVFVHEASGSDKTYSWGKMHILVMAAEVLDMSVSRHNEHGEAIKIQKQSDVENRKTASSNLGIASCVIMINCLVHRNCTNACISPSKHLHKYI